MRMKTTTMRMMHDDDDELMRVGSTEETSLQQCGGEEAPLVLTKAARRSQSRSPTMSLVTDRPISFARNAHWCRPLPRTSVILLTETNQRLTKLKSILTKNPVYIPYIIFPAAEAKFKISYEARQSTCYEAPVEKACPCYDPFFRSRSTTERRVSTVCPEGREGQFHEVREFRVSRNFHEKFQGSLHKRVLSESESFLN